MDNGLFSKDQKEWRTHNWKSRLAFAKDMNKAKKQMTKKQFAEYNRRIKENIVQIDGALEKVNKLTGVYYNKIDDETKNKEIGFIAQDVQEVVPELVTYAEDVDQYGVSYGNASALLVEAVKELTEQVNNLKQEIKEMKEKK